MMLNSLVVTKIATHRTRWYKSKVPATEYPVRSTILLPFPSHVARSIAHKNEKFSTSLSRSYHATRLYVHSDSSDER